VKWFISVSLILFFLFFFYFLNKIFSDNYISQKQRIEELIEKKDYNSSLKLIDSLISKNPDDGLLYYYRAEVFFLLKNYKDSLISIDKSIDSGYPLIDSYNLKALIYEELGDYKREVEFATKSIELSPAERDAYIIRSRTYVKMNNYDMALKDIDTLLMIDNDDELLIEKSEILLKMKRFKDSLEILYSLSKKYPYNIVIIYDMFLCYKEIGYYNNALYLISKLAIDKYPHYIEEKAIFLYGIGDYEYSYFEFLRYKSLTKPSKKDLELMSVLRKKLGI